MSDCKFSLKRRLEDHDYLTLSSDVDDDVSNCSSSCSSVMDPSLVKLESIGDSMSSTAADTLPAPKKKRQRLTHLSADEKLQRRKFKNRVAAQSARDRKKARMEDLEVTLERVLKDNEQLKKENSELKSSVRQLLDKNRKLLGEKKTSKHQQQQSSPSLPSPTSRSITTGVSGSAVDAAPIVADIVVAQQPASDVRSPHLGPLSRPIVSYVIPAASNSTSTRGVACGPTAASPYPKHVVAASPSSFASLAGQNTASAAAATSLGVDYLSASGQQEATLGAIGDHQVSDLMEAGDCLSSEPSFEKIDRMLDDMLSVLSSNAETAALNTNPIDNFVIDYQQDHGQDNIDVQFNAPIAEVELDLSVFDSFLNSDASFL